MNGNDHQRILRRICRVGMQAFPWKRKGFTLTEVLIVSAIIGVLATLMIPLVNNTKVAAGKSKCLNNLRQIQVACIEYAGENNGRFPTAEREFGFPHEYKNYSSTIGNYLSISRDKIMFCPGDLIKVRNAKSPLYSSNYTTYQYFNFSSPFLGTFSSNKPDFSRVSTLPGGVPLWGCLASRKSGNPSLAHSEPYVKKDISGMNVVYGDGHGGWVRGSELERYWNGDGADFYWPRPDTNAIFR